MWSQTRYNPTEDKEMQELAQRTAERAAQRKQRGASLERDRPMPDLTPALRTVGILELRYVRLLSSLCALSYGGHTKPGAVARRHGLDLVTHSAACTACTSYGSGGLAALESPEAQFEYGDAMASAVEPEPVASTSYSSRLANNIAAFHLPWRKRAVAAEESGMLDAAPGYPGATASSTGSFKELAPSLTDATPIVNPTPTHWFVADDPRDGTRYFVIQGSDSWDHWRVNLTLDPVEFEPGRGLATCVHRGVYEVAKTLYPLFLPLVREALLALMFAARGEIRARDLAPVYAFGARRRCWRPASEAAPWDGGRAPLRALGLDPGCLRGVTLHRDVVPRALACDCRAFADVLRRLSSTLRGHASLGRAQARPALYRHVGRLYVLQPPESLRFAGPGSFHPLLPRRPGLFRVVDKMLQAEGDSETSREHNSSSSSGASSSIADPDDAIWELLNSPHPLETLADPRSYGRSGAISRFHNPDNYTIACGAVLRSRGRRLRAVLQRVMERHGALHAVPRIPSLEDLAVDRPASVVVP
ncbi:hypothetical protein QBZ16_002496 [Prototheca wickerhamii]|uniref:Uncharacterized protein n=1 Tax=Prototheca wickerhamii TaxID=3111 RepID=A0AAD9MLR2_PROWI|nr:hypothetical protein QBZ16_002496 [Prototheca wickerhamii]